MVVGIVELPIFGCYLANAEVLMPVCWLHCVPLLLRQVPCGASTGIN